MEKESHLSAEKGLRFFCLRGAGREDRLRWLTVVESLGDEGSLSFGFLVLGGRGAGGNGIKNLCYFLWFCEGGAQGET